MTAALTIPYPPLGWSLRCLYLVMYLVSPRHLAQTSGFNPSQHPSTSLTRSPLPFAESPTPPCSPKSTGQIWNEHEGRALEKAKLRETSYAGSHLRTLDSQRSSSGTVLDIIKSYHSDPYAQASSPFLTPSPSPYLDSGFPDSLSKNHTTLASTTSSDAACSTCTQPPNLLSTSCPSSNEQPTENKEISEPHLGHAQQNPTSTHLPSLPQQRARCKAPALPYTSSQPSTRCGQMSDPQQQQHQQEQQAFHAGQCIPVYPMRSTSLGCPEPPPPPYNGLQDHSHHHHQGKEGNRSQQPRRIRNPSLTDPNAPRMRCFECKPLPPPPPSQQQLQQQQQCSTPPSPFPPAAAALHSSGSATPAARRVRANISSPPSATSLPDFPSPPSVSPSSRGIASPVRCASYALQQTVSVWDDDDDEKANLVDYFKRGFRGSKSSFLGGGGRRRGSEQVLLRKGRGQGQGRGWVGEFVRIVSCGCVRGGGGEGNRGEERRG